MPLSRRKRFASFGTMRRAREFLLASSDAPLRSGDVVRLSLERDFPVEVPRRYCDLCGGDVLPSGKCRKCMECGAEYFQKGGEK